ncbi:MAG: 4-hydroxy-tetrahydrodipicolinate synthase, partial [Clostridia bacterium]
MKKTVFEGSGVAIITPFTEDGVEYPKLGELIDFQIQQGTDCIVIAGTTGEASTMPDQEHIRTIQYTVERVAGRVPVLAGAGSNDTNHGAALCRAAQDVGADAVLLVTPYYNKTTQRGLYEHFAVMAKAIDIPIILYNVPSRTGMNMTPETVARLAKDFDNIVGIKECEFGHVGELKNLCGEDFSIYSGEDGLAVPL